jgi:hypothetical protein
MDTIAVPFAAYWPWPSRKTGAAITRDGQRYPPPLSGSSGWEAALPGRSDVLRQGRSRLVTVVVVVAGDVFTYLLR